MKKESVILGFTGEIASGKGEATSYLKNKYKTSYYKFSDPLRDILKRIHTDISRENLTNLTTSLRKKFGEDYLTHSLLNEINNDNNSFIVLDGIRKPSELNNLIKLNNFKLIYIKTDEKIRYQRIIQRGENNDEKNKSYEEFKNDLKLKGEIDIIKLKKIADFEIDNSGDLNSLHKQINNIIKKIKE